MDRITKNLLEKFAASQSLSELATEVQFEHFVNYLVMKQYDEDELSVTDFHTGTKDTMSIDGVGIYVNGSFVQSVEEVQDFASDNRYLDVVFVFVQSKTSPSFASGEIAKFLMGVHDFFSSEPELPRTEKMSDLEAIRDIIYADASLFKRGNPRLACYFASTGIWNDAPHPIKTINSHLKAIRGEMIFQEVEFFPLEGTRLQELYRAAEAALSVTFRAPKSIAIPTDIQVSEAHLALLPASEYIKLISDESGNIRRSIFYANVRDYQGENSVNKEIELTLKSERKVDFALRNNGVTVVAKELTRVGDNFTLKDYQIVNGCQTSHVIYLNRNFLGDVVQIPVKIVVTENEDIINSVIRSSNRQTEVTEEDFISLDEFQKKVESYFETFDGDQQIYYERRSKQYAGQALQKVKVITRGVLVRSFAAMFLDEPHRASRYYGRILKTVGKNIFAREHNLSPYYTAAYSAYRIEFLFRNSKLHPKYKNFRWHMLMGLRYLESGDQFYSITDKKIDGQCNKINRVLWSEDSSKAAFERVGALIDAAVEDSGRDFSSETARQQDFRDKLLMRVGS